MANIALFEKQPWQTQALVGELTVGGHNIVAQTTEIGEAFRYLHLMGDGKLDVDVIITSPKLEDTGKAHRFDHLHRGETVKSSVPYGLFGRTKEVEIPKVTSIETPAAVPYDYGIDVFLHARAILYIVRGLKLPTKVISNSAIRNQTTAYPMPIDAELGQAPERINAIIEAMLQDTDGTNGVPTL